jgi:hypothetical protein
MKRAMARLASSTAFNFTSRGSLANIGLKINPSIISDDEMAWRLVDAVQSRLTGYDRTVVFVALGCGESFLVIKHILTDAISNRLALPVATIAKVADWLNGYAGSPEEPRLRLMLDIIRLQQFDADSAGPVAGIRQGLR